MRSMLCGLLVLHAACTASAQVAPSASAPKQAESKDVSLDDLQGKTIHTTHRFTARLSGEKGEAEGGFTLRREIKIGPREAVHVNFTRDIWWDTRNGRETRREAGSDKSAIGLPMQKAGPRLFVLEGSTLTMLRVHDVGGHVLKISLQKSAVGMTCSAQSAMAREVGSGTASNTFHTSTGKVVISGAKAISSGCRVEATK
jgi:hypothetical protein